MLHVAAPTQEVGVLYAVAAVHAVTLYQSKEGKKNKKPSSQCSTIELGLRLGWPLLPSRRFIPSRRSEARRDKKDKNPPLSPRRSGWGSREVLLLF